MSDTRARDARRAARAAKGGAAGGGGGGGGHARSFALAAHGENVVMVDTASGRSWALASDDGALSWHPIGFKGGAERAPRGAGGGRDDDEA